MEGFISTKKAAQELSKSTRHIQKKCQSGEIRAKVYGRDYLIPLDEWEDYKARSIKDVKAG